MLRWDFDAARRRRTRTIKAALRPEDRRVGRVEQPGGDLARGPRPAARRLRAGDPDGHRPAGRWPRGPQGGRGDPRRSTARRRRDGRSSCGPWGNARGAHAGAAEPTPGQRSGPRCPSTRSEGRTITQASTLVTGYLVVRSSSASCRRCRCGMALRFARGLAWLAYRVDRRHRLVADENLRHAFPGQLRRRACDRLVRAVYRHFCTLLVEIVHLPRKLHPTTGGTTWTWPCDRQLVDRHAVGPAAAAGDGPLRQLGDGRLRARPARLPHATPSPGRSTTRTSTLPAPLPREDRADDPGQERRLRPDAGGPAARRRAGDAGRPGRRASAGCSSTSSAGRPRRTRRSRCWRWSTTLPIVVVGVPRVGEPMRYRVVRART